MTATTAAHAAAASQSGAYAWREIETAIEHLKRASAHACRAGDTQLATQCQTAVGHLASTGTDNTHNGRMP